MVSLPVEVRDAHGFSLHSSSDISSGGIFFDRAIPHPVGEQVTLRLHPARRARAHRVPG